MSSMQMTEQEKVIASDWGGGKSPFGISHGKLGMWLFLVSDALTFAGLLAGYLLVRMASPVWPKTSEVFGIGFVTAMTTILICSSAFMAIAVAAAHRNDRKALQKFLLLTIIGGSIFLGMQVYEWTHFIQAGAGLAGNPYGPPLFGAAFFVITGLHGTHVLSGVIYLILVARRVAQARSSAGMVENCGLYWHFVDLVWVLVFTLFYLI